MDQARNNLSAVSEPSTWEQIRERFPDQWVTLVEIDWRDDQGNDVRIAFVAGHGARRHANREARPLRSLFASLGSYFTGDTRAPSLPVVYVA